jgi:hypothetical protein
MPDLYAFFFWKARIILDMFLFLIEKRSEPATPDGPKLAFALHQNVTILKA